MRKLLVVLVALIAVAIFAGAQYIRKPGVSNFFEDVKLSNSVIIRVHQWLDASLTLSQDPFNVYDFGVEYEFDLGDLVIDSNAPVNVQTSIEFPSDMSGMTLISATPSGNIGDGTHDVKIKVKTDSSTKAAEYTINVTITLNPTVTF